MVNKHGRQHVGLNRTLGTWQISMICLSGIVGFGVFGQSSIILGVSGGLGVFLSFFIMSVVTICVTEGICALITKWPIENAMVEFVHHFVDEDFALIIGFLYWISNSLSFQALAISATDVFISFIQVASFNSNNSAPKFGAGAHIGICYAFEAGILLINCLPVQYFGWLEFGGGIIKLGFLFALFIIMIWINGKASNVRPILDDFSPYNKNDAVSEGAAVVMSIPLAAFAYLGVEYITFTAAEAKNPRVLRRSAESLAYIVSGFYIVLVAIFMVNVRWDDPCLPQLFSQPSANGDSCNLVGGNLEISLSSPQLAVVKDHHAMFIGISTFLVYSVLSAATTNLYATSRALYGLQRHQRAVQTKLIVPLWRGFGTLGRRSRVPWKAAIASVVLGLWIPLILLAKGNTATELREVLGEMGSLGALIAWMSQCMAYLSYRFWFVPRPTEAESPTGDAQGGGQDVDHSAETPPDGVQAQPADGTTNAHQSTNGYQPRESNLNNDPKRPMPSDSVLGRLQPWLAVSALLGCFSIIFPFDFIILGNGVNLDVKASSTIIMPASVIILLITFKIFRRKGNVRVPLWANVNQPEKMIAAIKKLNEKGNFIELAAREGYWKTPTRENNTSTLERPSDEQNQHQWSQRDESPDPEGYDLDVLETPPSHET